MNSLVSRDIYCCACEQTVAAEKVTGRVVYPHKPELGRLNFYQCPDCKNFVGCHRHRPDQPLGVIATPVIKQLRMQIHNLIDPLWQAGRFNRSEIYREISRHLGIAEYHTAEIKSVKDAQSVIKFVRTRFNTM